MKRQTAYCLALVLFATLVLLKFSPQTGFTSLIRFGETWSVHRHSSLQALPIAVVPSSNGYDGQFYAQIALDPTLRDAELPQVVVDAPAYRARRILMPALAALLGLGNPWWTIQAYAMLNVLAWLLFAWLLHRHIGGNDWIAYARWLGCVFSMGALKASANRWSICPPCCSSSWPWRPTPAPNSGRAPCGSPWAIWPRKSPCCRLWPSTATSPRADFPGDVS